MPLSLSCTQKTPAYPLRLRLRAAFARQLPPRHARVPRGLTPLLEVPTEPARASFTADAQHCIINADVF